MKGRDYPDVVKTILARPLTGAGGGIPLTRGEVAMLFLDGYAGDGRGLLDIRSQGYGDDDDWDGLTYDDVLDNTDEQPGESAFVWTKWNHENCDLNDLLDRSPRKLCSDYAKIYAMKLGFDLNLIRNYSSSSQVARVLTESWVEKNSYCPCCGNAQIKRFVNNQPVADFHCTSCSEEFELKSKNGNLGKKIVDGAYGSMLTRIASSNNPNFFFLTYRKATWSVFDFLIIPKQFFVPTIIERRTPLKDSARRAGWIGCNIDLHRIPKLGRIFLVRNTEITSKEDVLATWSKTLFLRNQKKEAKGWALDVLNCLDRIPGDRFSLDDIYRFEDELKSKHPENNFVRDKIRQQLQVLRDKGILEFTSRGIYRKLT